eukprot:TRINITY_DN71700_c0_g1_i1.p1 TRINITY_DN71700_c0_g1~~TRINITY_DN71700_c0_g1_i1.p1  ORF type:complete len:285 (+),score=51.52 TRINITY_DN71700_c0_g1_i1:77-856(+)
MASGGLQLYLRQGDEQIAIEVPPDATVADVIAEGGNRGGLTFCGRRLDPSEVLADAGVGAQAVLEWTNRGLNPRWARVGQSGEIRDDGSRFEMVRALPDYATAVATVAGGSIHDDGTHTWRVHITGPARCDFGVVPSDAAVNLDTFQRNSGAPLWHIVSHNRDTAKIHWHGCKQKAGGESVDFGGATFSEYDEQLGCVFLFSLTYNPGEHTGTLSVKQLCHEGRTERNSDSIDNVPRGVLPFWCFDYGGAAAVISDERC